MNGRIATPLAAIDLAALPSRRLLKLHAETMAELRARGIVRSANNPTGDLAEFLFCKAFGWTRAENSNPNMDAVARDGSRYQIKGRRLTPQNGSRQLSAIRDLAGGHFDFLAGVLFDEDYTVQRAALVPYAVVNGGLSTYVRRTNSHKFFLRDDVWNLPGVMDATRDLKRVKL